MVAAAIASALTADKLCVCILGNWYRDLYSVFDVQYVYTYMCIEGVHGSYGSLIRDMAAVSETPFVSYFTMWPVLVQHSRNVHRRKINNQ